MNIKNNFIKLILSVALIILGAYVLSNKFLRFDLTSEGRFTLSDYTIDILEDLNDEIYIKVYLEGEGLPVALKKYKREIKEELDEFKIYANDNLNYEFIDPAESSDREVRFAFYKSLTDKGLLPIETNEISSDGTSLQKRISGITREHFMPRLNLCIPIKICSRMRCSLMLWTRVSWNHAISKFWGVM